MMVLRLRTPSGVHVVVRSVPAPVHDKCANKKPCRFADRVHITIENSRERPIRSVPTAVDPVAGRCR